MANRREGNLGDQGRQYEQSHRKSLGAPRSGDETQVQRKQGESEERELALVMVARQERDRLVLDHGDSVIGPDRKGIDRPVNSRWIDQRRQQRQSENPQPESETPHFLPVERGSPRIGFRSVLQRR